ncbi:pirin family protein [Desulforamulus ruminis]|uniref:Pirin domain protein n=1 Tax=Desulforamulus ruminis (strain ATCC 23193 / DSM 2154 / NCIMB 8452 / DL) TaxID=696281 RepID=F6DR40_DESRL|nr:pirin family protein [Desulforamulus ruminis]AEG59759.1 Pirin domain protein [Desulforamulus ruminis DSM 2154]
MAIREIRKVLTGQIQYDGAGVKLVRVIGRDDVYDFDPFLMLDAFDSHDPADYIKGFPWHPHRGIETVTYLIRGKIEHGDSLGNKGNILDGECQWMTAGSGILHQEMPQAAERMLGVQLWLNLPRQDKMTVPQYRDLSAAKIPKIQEENATVGVISGHYQKTSGAIQGDYVKTLFLDVAVQAGASWRMATEKDWTLFIYILEGEGAFDAEGRQMIPGKSAVLFTEGEEIFAQSADKELRFLVFAGKPLKESIAWGGPIVMNTQEELQQAFKEIKEGTFIRENNQ